MSLDPQHGSGIQKYIDASKKLIAAREAALARMRTMKFDTIAVHGLYSMEEALGQNQGAIMEPLYLATAQAYRDADELEAALTYLIPTWCYTRIANPTTSYLEGMMALLEGYQTGFDTTCLVTASGLSAIVSAIDPFLTKQKDGPERMNFVSSVQIYGGTFQHFSVRKMKERGIECRWVLHPENMEEWKSKIDGETRFVYMEAPSNPQQSFCDIKALADLAHSCEVPVIFDATCATPALMRPIAHGVDIVVHSLTKSITSGGLAIGGAFISRKPIVTKTQKRRPAVQRKLRRICEVLAIPGQRPITLSLQRPFRAERPSHTPLEDGPGQPKLPEGRRVPPNSSEGLSGRLSGTPELSSPFHR